MAIGKLWKFFGSRTGMAILVAQLVLVLLFVYFYFKLPFERQVRVMPCG